MLSTTCLARRSPANAVIEVDLVHETIGTSMLMVPAAPRSGWPRAATDRRMYLRCGGKPIEQLRAICLALPETEEKEAWGDPTFRVRGKIFAMIKRGDGRVSVWCKAPPGSQMVLVGADPMRFFVPPYVGHKGWVGVWLDDNPDWGEVEALIERSYRLIAPKRLAALID